MILARISFGLPPFILAFKLSKSIKGRPELSPPPWNEMDRIKILGKPLDSCEQLADWPEPHPKIMNHDVWTLSTAPFKRVLRPTCIIYLSPSTQRRLGTSHRMNLKPGRSMRLNLTAERHAGRRPLRLNSGWCGFGPIANNAYRSVQVTETAFLVCRSGKRFFYLLTLINCWYIA